MLLIFATIMPLLAATATGHMTIGHAHSGRTLKQLVVIWRWTGRDLDFWAINSAVFDSDSIWLASGHGPIPDSDSNSVTDSISDPIGPIVTVVPIPLRRLDLCLGSDITIAVFLEGVVKSVQDDVMVGVGEGVVIWTGRGHPSVNVNLDCLLRIVETLLLLLGDIRHVSYHPVVITGLSGSVGAVRRGPCALVLALPASVAAANAADHAHDQHQEDHAPKCPSDDVIDVEGQAVVVGQEGGGLREVRGCGAREDGAVNCGGENIQTEIGIIMYELS